MPGACGIAATANYLRLLDSRFAKITERDVMESLDTLPNLEKGISEDNISYILAKFGFPVVNHYDLLLEKALARRPLIACVDLYEHWIILAGNDKIIAVDSDAGKPRIYELLYPQLDNRWKFNGLFFSIKVDKE